MVPLEKLDSLIARFERLEADLAKGPEPEAFVRLSKEYAELEPVARKAQDYRGTVRELADVRSMLSDPSADGDMRALAESEMDDLKDRLDELGNALQVLLLPRDAADDRSVIIEIRAGTGGDEAALFAGTLYRMYQRYAEISGWKTEVISIHESDLGGVRELVLNIIGRGAFARLKFESGVHRVQRVPETESGGRIHTSAATVAVLPEAEEFDVTIAESDLKIDTYRASGAGGQHVNTTDSAVRITHLPTGIVVAVQDERSQHKNKARALKLLKSKIFEEERARIDSERSQARRGQVGTGDRSERIRTYNFPQGRLTDHRIGLTLYKLDQVVAGEALGEVIDALTAEHQANLLADMGAQV